MARGASCVRSRAVPRTEERLQTLADPEARWLDPVDGSGRGSCAAECLGVRGVVSAFRRAGDGGADSRRVSDSVSRPVPLPAHSTVRWTVGRVAPRVYCLAWYSVVLVRL